MPPKHPRRRKVKLKTPLPSLRSEDLLSFVELRPFTRRWALLGLSDQDLFGLQNQLLVDPKAGDVVAGTGGLRKLRFAPPNSKTGKSGALRIAYAYFEEVAIIVLGVVYHKSEKDDLTEDEKKALRTAMERVRRSLLSRPYRSGKKK